MVILAPFLPPSPSLLLSSPNLSSLIGSNRWKATVLARKQDQVLVHYVGCEDDDEDEWIPESSHRFRWYAPFVRSGVYQVSQLCKSL